MFSDIIQPVKKLLLIFLLVLLPLQFCWAAAATYCQHEGEKSTQHFGHHSHQHDAQTDSRDDADKGVKAHADCGYCHLFCQVSFLTAVPEIVLPTGATHVEKPDRPYSSHIPNGLHRPDWRLVA